MRPHGWKTPSASLAALDIATGQVFGQCRKRHRHEQFLSFLRLIDREVPAELDIHLVLDNYATHKHAKVRRWLAARPRFHLHFTPTSASWLNQVERWFGLLSQRAIKRGSFRSVADLVMSTTLHSSAGRRATSRPHPSVRVTDITAEPDREDRRWRNGCRYA